MTDIDTAAIRALYGDSDFVTVSVYGLEMLLQEHERLRAKATTLTESLARANGLGNSMVARAEAAEARINSALAIAERADHMCVCDDMIRALTGDAE